MCMCVPTTSTPLAKEADRRRGDRKGGSVAVVERVKIARAGNAKFPQRRNLPTLRNRGWNGGRQPNEAEESAEDRAEGPIKKGYGVV